MNLRILVLLLHSCTALAIDDTVPDAEGMEGCVWAVEGSSSSNAGTNRLCQFALDGVLRHEWRTTDRHATRVTVDIDRQGVWVLFSKPMDDEIVFIDRQGESHERFLANDCFYGKRIDNIHLDGEGKLWVVGYTEDKGQDPWLFRFDIDLERVVYQTPLPERMTICWMTTLASTESFEEALSTELLKPCEPVSLLTARRTTSAASPALTLRPSSAAAKQRALAKSATPAPDARDWALQRLAQNIAQVPITDEQLRAVFNSYDIDRNGSLSKREIRQIYKSFDSFGMDDGQEMDRIINSFNMMGDGTVSYEEFAIMMLKLAQR